MNFTVVAQLTFACLTFITTITLVFIPRRLLHTNSHIERNYRLLDLTNYFSLGVFSATCFIVLLPHVLSSFMTAVSYLQWNDTLAYKTVLSVAMAGFFLVFLLEKLGEYCQGGGGSRRTLHDPLTDPLDKPSLDCHADNFEGNKDSESYVVTFQDDYDDDEEEDDEMNRGDDNDEEKVGNVLIKSDDKINEEEDEEEDDDDDDYDEDAKLVRKPILVNRNKNNSHNNNKRNKKVTFKYNNNNNKATRSHGNSCQRLVVGGKQHNNNTPNNNTFNIRCFTLLVSLTTHSVFEGLSVGLMGSFWPTIHLSTSITLHQMLAAIAVGASLSRHQLTTTSFVFSNLIFSSSIPVGVLAGMGLVYMRGSVIEDNLGGNVLEIVSSSLQAVTVGTFLYVVFVEVLSSEMDRHRDILWKLLLMFLGFALISSLSFLLP